ncbi:MAG: GDP-mannose 4,6-dehydratase [Candidatus Omnitrophica bacterium]|nr:GDP-mannose 4,6-dehydratase [Candidatus Omnitrophota bacterium]
MKNLITGGAGFIGSHLAEELLNRGEEVAVIDNLSTGSMRNIAHLKSRSKFSYHINTIMNRPLMRRLIKQSDEVYHLAAAVGVKYIIDNPLESIRTNINGTEIVLDLAYSLGKKKVIMASTSEVYGKNRPGKSTFSEDDDRVLGPTTTSRWSYSCTKAVDEFLALAYWHEKRMPVVIVRFFNTCGPRQTGRYGMVVPRFVKQAISGEPITVYDDGKQSRCFTDISDAIKAIILLSRNPRAMGGVFNIGNPENNITINALAKKIRKMAGSVSPLKHISYSKAYHEGFEDMRHRKPDISKLKRVTGFEPAVSIDDMLKGVIEDLRHGNGRR